MSYTDQELKTVLQLKFTFYVPNPKQASFHGAGKEAVERLFLAGNRTGKTYCGCIEDAIHLTGVYPDWWEGHRFNHPIVAWVVSLSTKKGPENCTKKGPLISKIFSSQ